MEAPVVVVSIVRLCPHIRTHYMIHDRLWILQLTGDTTFLITLKTNQVANKKRNAKLLLNLDKGVSHIGL